MYNGIGLTTPRGSGTSGYVQRNFAAIKQRREKVEYKTDAELARLDKALNKQPNKEILEHQWKRNIELKCVIMQEELEEQGYSESEVTQRVSELRAKLVGDGYRSSEAAGTSTETHQYAEATQKKKEQKKAQFKDILQEKKSFTSSQETTKIDRKHYGESSSSPFLLSSAPGDDTSKAVPPDPDPNEEENAHTLMTRLTKFIYNSSDITDIGRIRTRAMLCHIYHHAIHDRVFQAKDLMLMSHLQENIHFADVLTQILYNRALVQLGMCAFRHGMIKDAHDALVDVQSSGRSKELLAQGLLARHDRTTEQEKVERRRQIPFHMHINLELMECVYLTAAMLHEIPYMTAAKREGRRRIISKSFHHQLNFHEKQPLIGVCPPESMREHVVAAAHAMQKGDWKACRDYITSIKVWDLFINVDQVKEMMTRKIQEETLRTYIFAYGETYDCLSLQSLVDMFELPLQTVHSVVSKMIFREEMMASLDEPTRTVVIHHAAPNKLQCQALLLADKLNTLADQNEEMMKLKHAGPWDVGQHTGGGATGPFRQGQMWRQGKHGGQRRQIQTRA